MNSTELVTLATVELLLEACRKFADEHDYCIVCNNHPSSGHSRTCPLYTITEAPKEEKP